MLDSLFGTRQVLIIEVHDFNLHNGVIPVMVLADSETGPVSVMAPLSNEELNTFLARCKERSYKVARIGGPSQSKILNRMISVVVTPGNKESATGPRPPARA